MVQFGIGNEKDRTYEFGERFPSGVAFCFAATSLSTTGALGDVVRDVADADLRSVGAGVCVEGARVGKLDWGLEPGSDEGGGSGAETDATAVDMSKVVGEWCLQQQQVAIKMFPTRGRSARDETGASEIA